MASVVSTHPDAADSSTCHRCAGDLPADAVFCHRCGADATLPSRTGTDRPYAWAAHPDHGVLRPRLVTTLTPLLHGTAPRTYATALGVGAATVAALALVGWDGPALVAAVLLVPTLLVLSQRDANVWEGTPIPVLAGTIGLGAGLGAAVTLTWTTLLEAGSGAPGEPPSWAFGSEGAAWSTGTVLVVAVAVPIVGGLLCQIGPATVTSRSRYDDLLDRVTFGLATGAAWAAAESLVADRALLADNDPLHSTRLAAGLVVMTSGIVAPIAMAAATALAAAVFPGIPTLRGNRQAAVSATGLADPADLPTWRMRRAARRTLRRAMRARTGPLLGRFALALGEAIAYGVAVHLGRIAGTAVGGTTGAIVWSVVTAAVTLVAIVRLRTVVHGALLASARRAIDEGRLSRHAAVGEAWCGHCEAPLAQDAAFCSACGLAVRAAGKRRRTFNADPHTRLIVARPEQRA